MPIDDDPFDRAILDVIAERLRDSDEALSAAWLRKLFADNHRKIDEQPLRVVVDEQPDDKAIESWILRNPKAFANWIAKQNRIRGTRIGRYA